LIIPGQIVAFDEKGDSVSQRWFQLRSLFEKSDQCLTIEDPCAFLLDIIHNGVSEDATEDVHYFVARFPVDTLGDGETQRAFLRRSLAYFRAKETGQLDDIEEQINKAIKYRQDVIAAEVEVSPNWREQLASNNGVLPAIIHSLDTFLADLPWREYFSADEWTDAVFSWIETVEKHWPSLLGHRMLENCRKWLADNPDTQATLPNVMRECVRAWTHAQGLVDMQRLVSPAGRAGGHCERAREVALDWMRNLSYVAGIFAQVFCRRQSEVLAEESIPITLACLPTLIREGWSEPEMIALRQLEDQIVSRHHIKRRYEAIRNALEPRDPWESFAGTVKRVRSQHG
jgi:hypothetical protein